MDLPEPLSPTKPTTLPSGTAKLIRSTPFECHLKLQTKRGIWNLENMDLSQLVADKAYEFLFAWSPLKIKGATGSPGNPIALY
jgi:kynurenine formamidase